MSKFVENQEVEFCPVATRDTGAVKWRPASYVSAHRGLGRGWHLLREATGNIVSIPTRRIRNVSPPSPPADSSSSDPTRSPR